MRAAVLLALLTAAPWVFAQSSLKLYAALRADVERVQLRGPSATRHVDRLVNNGSYLGFRADEDLGDGLRAWAQIEGSVGLDDGSGALAGRNTGVGVSSPAGILMAGQWDSPYKAATGFLDPFSGTTDGVYLGVLGGNLAATAGAQDAPRAAFERRVRNVLQAWSPPGTAPWEARLAVGLSEASNHPTAALTAGSLAWRTPHASLGAAAEVHRSDSSRDTAVKIFGQIAFGPHSAVGMVAERIRWRGALGGLVLKGRPLQGTLVGGGYAQIDSLLVAGTHEQGRWHFNLSVGADRGVRGPTGAVPSSHATLLAVGVAYSLGPHTELCGLLARVGNGSNSGNDFGSNRLAVAPGTQLLAVGLGVVQRF